ncbi:MoxR-like ATPase [Clostridium cavendishii DSM 21758]|uniref:MoxR-like ATPase n=1 Tax=Clostridium cavendishii DSM 21758 TaxID=1121302 RepID=A0A1M6MPX6_9CLOT|nr:AAA family ATPase [Clostridium cavendishii]SHJ85343.1 MoxR-like ATPase [Clostridium cavendishii DSM 21758]
MENKVIAEIRDNVSRVVIGKEKEVIDIIKAMIVGGHVLIEDVPGVGKTTLVKALAKSLDLKYSRIQFTPDLLPSDITGVSIYNQKSGEFEFKKGPIFSNIVLADEINRTSPKTQSALLEVMEEKQISEGGETYNLNSPFMVLATQNPIDYDGTYRLPEAQLDRFIMKIRLGYASFNDEVKVLEIYRHKKPLEDIIAIATANDVEELYEAINGIKVDRTINEYIIKIVEKTRNSKYIELGVSTRGAMALQKIAMAEALIDDRDYVIPDDVKNNVIGVLSHRLILSQEAKVKGYTEERIMEEILKNTETPMVK